MQILIDSQVTKQRLIEKLNKRIDFLVKYQKEKEDWAIEKVIKDRNWWKKINPFLKKYDRKSAWQRIWSEGFCGITTGYQSFYRRIENDIITLEKMKKVIEQAILLGQDIALEQEDIDILYQ